jgi:FG-GAP repeat
VSWRPRIRSVQLAWLGGVAALLLLAAAVTIWSVAGAQRHARQLALSRNGLTSLPVTARGPISAALGSAEPSYRVLGLRARNAAQRLGVAFSRTGVTVVSGKTRVHLALLASGHGSALGRVGSVAPESLANRVAYAHAGVREWYANGPLGLEQGFDVAGAPARGQGPLTLSLALSGNVRVRLEHSGVLLKGPGAALRYAGLSVSDARGRMLDSWLALRPRRLLIRVDDRGAVYPLKVDPLLQQAELRASDGAAGDGLGFAVAISGNTIVAGATRHTVGANARQGAAYVFTMPASGWANATQSAELTASDGGAGDGLGFAVAVSGSTIVAGARFHKVSVYKPSGAAYVSPSTFS